jgi:hypothetical protein
MFQKFMELIQGATVSLPAVELSALILVLTLALMFRFSRSGIIAAYLFTYKRGWNFLTDHNQGYLMCYLIFGVLVGVLGVISMLISPTHKE